MAFETYTYVKKKNLEVENLPWKFCENVWSWTPHHSWVYSQIPDPEDHLQSTESKWNPSLII